MAHHLTFSIRSLWLIVGLSLILVTCTAPPTASPPQETEEAAPVVTKSESMTEEVEPLEVEPTLVIDLTEEPGQSEKEEEIPSVETVEVETQNDKNEQESRPPVDDTAESSASEPFTTAVDQPNAEIFRTDDRSSLLRGRTFDWNTNFNLRTISTTELLSGGPSRDGIPSIDNPQFVAIGKASEWVAENEPIILLEINDDVRAYPLQIMTWHEIANDTVGEVPVVVTFCPLCNSAVAFDRRVEGMILEFGVSGLLRNSDLVMYDRNTETLWQQFTGDALVGQLVPKRLKFYSTQIVSFGDFKDSFPGGKVLSRDTGFNRPYGQNPYIGYDTYENPLSQNGNLLLFRGEVDRRLAPADRVVTVTQEEVGSDVAYPVNLLKELGVINDSPGNQDLVIFFSPGTASALGAATIASAEDVGATGVFQSTVDGETLFFAFKDEKIVDRQTGSTWNIFGEATSGPLAGTRLEPIIHGDHFWFSWAAFKPDTLIYDGSEP